VHAHRLQCTEPADQVKEKAEKYLDQFIKNQDNSEALTCILRNSANQITLFVTVEMLTKTYLVDSGIGLIECKQLLTRLRRQGQIGRGL